MGPAEVEGRLEEEVSGRGLVVAVHVGRRCAWAGCGSGQAPGWTCLWTFGFGGDCQEGVRHVADGTDVFVIHLLRVLNSKASWCLLGTDVSPVASGVLHCSQVGKQRGSAGLCDLTPRVEEGGAGTGPRDDVAGGRAQARWCLALAPRRGGARTALFRYRYLLYLRSSFPLEFSEEFVSITYKSRQLGPVRRLVSQSASYVS